MQLLLDSNGLTLTKRNQSFYIYHKTKGRRYISPHRITSIAVVRDCLISSAAIRLAAKHQIPIHFCSAVGKAEAAVFSAQYTNLSTIRRQQVLWAEGSEGTAAMIAWFALKTAHQIKHLQQLKKLEASARTKTVTLLKRQQMRMNQWREKPIAEARNSLLGIEGSAARAYWQAVSAALPETWQFSSRSRRPAQDAFNCVLNYLYGMTYNVVEGAIRGAGLDPFFGFFHVDGYGRPTLVFDMIEPFRPWVDALLTAVIQEMPQLRVKDFEKKNGGWWLSKRGRKFWIPKYNDYLAERIRWQDYHTSRKNHIYRLAGQLAQQLKPPTDG